MWKPLWIHFSFNKCPSIVLPKSSSAEVCARSLGIVEGGGVQVGPLPRDSKHRMANQQQ